MRRLWLVVLAFTLLVAGCVEEAKLEPLKPGEYEVTIFLHDKDKPVRGIEVLYSGEGVGAGIAGVTDRDGRVTVRPLRNEVDFYFNLAGYDEPIRLLRTFKGGSYWVSATTIGAPGIYVDWHGVAPEGYDIMQVDWYCQDNAEATYWAVLNWDTGYAGFQETGDGRILLMSLWDLEDGTEPQIEYVWHGNNGRFDHEGSGRFVMSEYSWKPQTWYTMRVQYWVEDGKSYYSQWVCEEGGEWLQTAIFSYPVIAPRFRYNTMFQEDWAGNNLGRSCRLKNMYARKFQTDAWESWSRYKVTTAYIPITDHTGSVFGTTYASVWDYVFGDITFGIDYALGPEKDYIWVQNGGSDFTPTNKMVPITLNVRQPNLPHDTEWLMPQEHTSPFAGGRGTVDDPYLIETAEHFDQVRNYLYANFKQIKDISLKEYSQGEGWVPIGFPNGQLSGSYDGNGYKIADLVIKRPKSDDVGLFRQAHILKNINLENVEVTARNYSAGLVGTCNKVINCHVTGTVQGDTLVGGLAGSLEGSAENCSFAGTVTSKKGYGVGGLAGFASGEISNSYAKAKVSGTVNVGVLVGWLTGENALVENSFAEGEASGNSYVGGLIGVINYNANARKNWASVKVTATGSDGIAGGYVGDVDEGSLVENSFAAGEVNSKFIGGGFVGNNNGQIKNSYALGRVKVSGSRNRGGFAGTINLAEDKRQGLILNSFYDLNTTGQKDSGKGIGKTTGEMKQQNTFEGWDFGAVWSMDENMSYPALRNN